MPRPNCVINLRAREPQRELIDRAAEVQGKNRTEFMLNAAVDRANDVLSSRQVFHVDEETFLRFVAALDAPIEPNPRLERLLATPAPWER